MRADEFLAARRIAVRETADARKERFEKHDLRELFKGARRVIAIKAKKRVEFDLAREFDLEALAEVVIGPTGGLRAPTLLVGDAVLVGFGPEEWAEYFDAQ